MYGPALRSANRSDGRRTRFVVGLNRLLFFILLLLSNDFNDHGKSRRGDANGSPKTARKTLKTRTDYLRGAVTFSSGQRRRKTPIDGAPTAFACETAREISSRRHASRKPAASREDRVGFFSRRNWRFCRRLARASSFPAPGSTAIVPGLTACTRVFRKSAGKVVLDFKLFRGENDVTSMFFARGPGYGHGRVARGFRNATRVVIKRRSELR